MFTGMGDIQTYTWPDIITKYLTLIDISLQEMAGKIPFKLKDPQTVRIFLSSPFNGMEKERETLAKFYWPKLESLLAARGLKLRLVDLRWGITSTSSSDSQTVNICLREVERSDIFIGLYAQRYGWHGKDDEELQKNYTVSKVRFPWIQKYIDKSVTELEYRLGHLNNPGVTPACFCFRNKKYDDNMMKEAQAAHDDRRVRFFASENYKAQKHLDALKREVKESEKHTLGVLSTYTDPDVAVKFIYDRVSAFVEREILYDSVPPTEREKSLLSHTCFLENRCGTYIGGEKYLSKLDKYINDEDVSQPLTVTGEPGSGKSALLATWAKKHMAENTGDILFYHFVGCEPKSSTRTNLLLRLVENMHLLLTSKEYDGSIVLDEKELLATFEDLLSKKLESEEHRNKRLIIIVDRINQMRSSRTSKRLFWLPKILPKRMRVIVTVTNGSEDSEEVLELLNEEYQSRNMQMLPLTYAENLLLTQAILDENSKSMEKEQLELIVKSPKTKDPFFLFVLINELCVSGNFRRLTQQIKTLLMSGGVHGLLCNVLKRVDRDYQNPDVEVNIVERILCAVVLSRDGLYEVEIPYAEHIWAPVIYALEKFLINRSGMISFSFPEMSEAVETFYMDTEEKKMKIAESMSLMFLEPYRRRLNSEKPQDERIVLELPYHLRRCNDKEQMIEVLSNIEVFNIFFANSRFDLNEYWNFTGLRSDEIASLYIKNIDPYIKGQPRKLFETERDEERRKTNLKVEILEDMIDWMDTMKLYHGLGLLQDFVMEIEEKRSDVSTRSKLVRQVQAKHSKACILSDCEKYEEALTLHKEVLEGRMTLIEEGSMDVEGCIMSYNGIGLCFYQLGEIVEAGKWFKKALTTWKKETCANAFQLAGTYTNLGLVHFNLQEFPDAFKCFQESNNLHEVMSPTQISLNVAFNYHNMALVAKNLKNIEAAEMLYQQSLRIKEKLLGSESYDVALTLMNIGTLWAQKKDHKASLKYNRMSLEILKKVALSDSSMIFLAQENVVNALTSLDSYEKAEPLYREVFNHQKDQPGGIASGMVHIHRRMITYYLKKRQCEKAADIAIGLLTSPVARPTDLAQLIMADASIHPEKRANRPVETTFEFGMKKWPNQRDIIRSKLLYTLHVEQKDFFSFVASYCESEAAKSGEGGGYNLLIDITLSDLKDASLATKLVMLGLKIQPENAYLLAKMEELKINK